VEKDNQVTLGKIGAVYGIKGWIKVHSFTDDPEAIFDYSPWSLNLTGRQQYIEVSDWKRHNNGLIAKLKGVDDRDMAQQFVGAEIAISADALPELPEGEYYWRDLIGMTVKNIQGYHLGVVEDILETGSNDVLVLKANANDAFGKKERLIPYLFDQVIESIDTEQKQIIVDWEPGF
jgi:16S rRNA processing protein RimM